MNWIPLFVYFVYFFKKSSWNLKVENYTKEKQICRHWGGHLSIKSSGILIAFVTHNKEHEILYCRRWYNKTFHISNYVESKHVIFSFVLIFCCLFSWSFIMMVNSICMILIFCICVKGWPDNGLNTSLSIYSHSTIFIQLSTGHRHEYHNWQLHDYNKRPITHPTSFLKTKNRNKWTLCRKMYLHWVNWKDEVIEFLNKLLI